MESTALSNAQLLSSMSGEEVNRTAKIDLTSDISHLISDTNGKDDQISETTEYSSNNINVRDVLKTGKFSGKSSDKQQTEVSNSDLIHELIQINCSTSPKPKNNISLKGILIPSDNKKSTIVGTELFNLSKTQTHENMILEDDNSATTQTSQVVSDFYHSGTTIKDLKNIVSYQWSPIENTSLQLARCNLTAGVLFNTFDGNSMSTIMQSRVYVNLSAPYSGTVSACTALILRAYNQIHDLFKIYESDTPANVSEFKFVKILDFKFKYVPGRYKYEFNILTDFKDDKIIYTLERSSPFLPWRSTICNYTNTLSSISKPISSDSVCKIETCNEQENFYLRNDNTCKAMHLFVVGIPASNVTKGLKLANQISRSLICFLKTEHGIEVSHEWLPVKFGHHRNEDFSLDIFKLLVYNLGPIPYGYSTSQIEEFLESLRSKYFLESVFNRVENKQSNFGDHSNNRRYLLCACTLTLKVKTENVGIGQQMLDCPMSCIDTDDAVSSNKSRSLCFDLENQACHGRESLLTNFNIAILLLCLSAFLS